MKKEVYVLLGLNKLEEIQLDGQFNSEKVAVLMSRQKLGINPEGSTNSSSMEYYFSSKLEFLNQRYNYLCLVKANIDEKNLKLSEVRRNELCIFRGCKPQFEPRDILGITKICETVKLRDSEYLKIALGHLTAPNLPSTLNEPVELLEKSRKEHLNTLRILAQDSNKESISGFASLPYDMKFTIALFLGNEARSSKENYKLVQFMFTNINELTRAVKAEEIAQVKITVGPQDVSAAAMQLVQSQSFFSSAKSITASVVNEECELKNTL